MAYIMPVKYNAFTKDSISLNTAEKNAEESPEIKKDNTKELLNNSNEQYIIAYAKPVGYNTPRLLLSTIFNLVETPPPDIL